MSSDRPSDVPPPGSPPPGYPPPGSPPPGYPPPGFESTGFPPPGSTPLPDYPPGPAHRPDTPPGYGPPPASPPGQAWGSAPAGLQDPAAGAYPPYAHAPVLNTRPGIIPLRPLGVGDILDGAFKTFRRNQGPVLALSALVNAVAAGPALLTSLVLARGIISTSATFNEVGGPAFVSFAVLVLTTGFTTICLTVFVSSVVGEAALGRRTSLSAVWAATRGRLWRAVVLQLALSLAMVIPFGLISGPGIVLLARSDGDSGGGWALVLLAVVALVPWSVWLTVKTLLATPALVLESTSLRVAIRRSFSLTRGLFWRTLGISLVAGLIAGIVGQALQLPLGMAFAVLAGVTGTDAGAAVWLVLAGQSLALLISSVVTIPFIATVNALLYIDARIRREAFDQVLMRAANPGIP